MKRRILLILLIVFCGIFSGWPKIQEAQAQVAFHTFAISTPTTATTTFTIPIPATIVTGEDLYVLFVSRDHTSATALATLTDNDTGGNTWLRIGGSTDRKLNLFWKKSTSATASKTITVAGCVGSCAGGLSAFTGGAANNPTTNIVVEDNIAADETHAGFTPDNADSFIVFGVINATNALDITLLAAATLGTLEPEQWAAESTGGSDCKSTLTGKVNSGITATGNFTWAQTDAITISVSFALKPPPTPADPVIASSTHTDGAKSNVASATFTCSAGTPTPDHYHYLWDQTSTHTKAEVSAGTQWDGTTLNKTCTSDGNWYLHAISHDISHVESANIDTFYIDYNGTAPQVNPTATAQNATTVRIVYNEAVKHVDPGNLNDALRPGNYSILPSLAVSSVIHVSGDTTFDLTTASQTPSQSYTIYIINVQDVYGNVINPAFDEATFTGYAPPAPTVNQTHYRFRNDDGTETAATWRSLEDEITTSVKSSNIRLRFAIANTGSASADGYYYLLEYSTNLTDWYTVPVTATTEPFEMTLTANYIDNDPTTTQLTGTGTFAAGKCVEDPSNKTVSYNLSNGYYTEFEYCLQATNYATDASTYYFRLSNNGSDLNTYSVYAQLVVGQYVGASTSSNVLRLGEDRHTFYDGTNYWAFYITDSSYVVYEKSSDGTTWTNTPVKINTTNQTFTSLGIWENGTYAYVCYSDGTNSYEKRITIADGTLGTERTITSSGDNQPQIIRDSSGYLWRKGEAGPTTPTFYLLKSTNPDDDSAWGTEYSFGSDATGYGHSMLIPVGAGNIVALYQDGSTIMYKKFSDPASQGTANSVVADCKNGISADWSSSHYFSAVADSSNRVHLIYIDSVTDDLEYTYYNGTSWSTPTTVAAGTFTNPTLTRYQQ